MKATSYVTVTLVSAVLILAYNAFVLSIVSRLEQIGCPCAQDWRLKYVSIFTATYTVWLLGILALGAAAPGVLETQIMRGLGLLMGIAGIVNLVVSVQYVLRLRQEDCACSESASRTAWEVLLWLYVAYAIVMLFTGVAAAAFLAGLVRGASKRGTTLLRSPSRRT